LASFREFSSAEGLLPKERSVDSDAPREFRNELVDLVFSLADEPVSEERIYRLMTQNIGASVAGNPYGGYRYEAGVRLWLFDIVRMRC